MNVPIVLWSHDVIKLLEVGNHITYMPKAKGTLYVGYTQYPNLPKTQEGYMRQGKDVEDDFILFKQGLLELKSNAQSRQGEGKVMVPDVLYLPVKNDYIDYCLDSGLSVSANEKIRLFKGIEEIENLNKNNITILKIDSLLMHKNDYIFFYVNNQWYTQKIPSVYISLRA